MNFINKVEIYKHHAPEHKSYIICFVITSKGVINIDYDKPYLTIDHFDSIQQSLSQRRETLVLVTNKTQSKSIRKKVIKLVDKVRSGKLDNVEIHLNDVSVLDEVKIILKN